MTSRIINHHGNVEEVSDTFTPGPWGSMNDGPAARKPWEPWTAHLEAAPGLTIGSPHNTEPIARVSGYCQPCEANAHLIAAAPELYAELDHARELLALDGVFVDAIDNALAKARGEQ